MFVYGSVSGFVSSMLSAWCSSCVGLRQQYAVSLLMFVLCRASSAVCCQLGVRPVSGFVSSMLSVLVFVLCYAVSLSSAWALSANTMLYRIYSLLSNSVHLILIQLCSVQNALMGLDSEVDVLSERRMLWLNVLPLLKWLPSSILPKRNESRLLQSGRVICKYVYHSCTRFFIASKFYDFIDNDQTVVQKLNLTKGTNFVLERLV